MGSFDEMFEEMGFDKIMSAAMRAADPFAQAYAAIKARLVDRGFSEEEALAIVISMQTELIRIAPQVGRILYEIAEEQQRRRDEE